MRIEDTSVDMVSNVDQVRIDEDTLQSTVTGFIDVEKIIIIGDKIFFIEKKLPFSYMTIVTNISGSNVDINDCNNCNDCN